MQITRYFPNRLTSDAQDSAQDVGRELGAEQIMDGKRQKLKPGDKVLLKGLPPGFLDDLPIEDQQAISEMVGKPILLVDFEDDGRVELEFDEPGGQKHLIYVDLNFIRPV